ncbi:MAG: Crp/Fnr family transcriptional regulator [Hyphomicrobiaceae bacterium]|nr:Crp/Fnr family transcriptional regulator [Hyphomicrobiaceae bacterium]
MLSKSELRDVAFWSEGLSEVEFERVRRGLTEKACAAGSTICHRGDRLDYWTGVGSGLLKISAVSKSGKAITFAGVGPGGWFGEGTILKKEPRKYDLVALRDTRLLLLNQATFDWLFENSVGFNRYLVRQLNERMGQFIATIEYDRLLAPAGRVARHIAWLCNPVLYPKSGPLIEIGQEELALLVGVSRQVVNKCLQELEAEGLLSVARNGVTVKDRQRLQVYGE